MSEGRIRVGEVRYTADVKERNEPVFGRRQWVFHTLTAEVLYKLEDGSFGKGDVFYCTEVSGPNELHLTRDELGDMFIRLGELIKKGESE